MKKDVKFTIFTGFYNYLDNIETLYESIKAQTNRNWEWLICDDYSESPDVIKKLKEIEANDSRVRVIYPKWKKHYYWNVPVSEASGEFIILQDSDDRMHAKLLESYLYHFEKFPELAIIGSSSILKNENPNGHSVGAKYVRYGEASNFMEALERNVYSISGDARGYRKSAIMHRGEIVRENEYTSSMGDDILKMLNYEECGKFVCLPRVLHDYSFREGSVSGPMWEFRGESKEVIQRENNSMREKAKARNDREYMDSIFSYYDGSFDRMYQMYHSNLGRISYRASVEYYNRNITARDRIKIGELYFDHDFHFNSKTNHSSHLIFSVGSVDDIVAYSERTSVIEDSLEEIVITLESGAKEIKDQMESAIYASGFGGWYFIDYGDLYTYLINPRTR